MIFGKRLLAALALLLGTAGLLLSLALGVAVWVVKGPATAKAEKVFGRVDEKLDLAEQKLAHAQESVAKAAKGLESVKEKRREEKEIPPQTSRADLLKRAVARSAALQVAPGLADAHDDLHTVAEAAFVVNSVLDDLGSLPFLAESGFDTDRLTEINTRIGAVGPAAWKMSEFLGGGPSDTDEPSVIERVLTRAQAVIADYQNQAKEVRQRTTALKTKTLAWIMPGAAIFSFVCFWIALSQVSILVHTWSWWKGRNAS
jgi:hypothetical protein